VTVNPGALTRLLVTTSESELPAAWFTGVNRSADGLLALYVYGYDAATNSLGLQSGTWALSNATLPYAVALAGGLPAAVAAHPELLGGINVARGKVTHQAVAESLGMEYADPAAVVA